MFIYVLVILLGLLPFAVGSGLNFLLLECDTFSSYWSINIGALLLWALIAYVFRVFVKSTPRVVILLNSIAFVVLLLVGIQELVFHAYWLNIVGAWSQFYFLPFIQLGFVLSSGWTGNVFVSYCIAFLSMIGASVVGCLIRGNRKHVH